MFCRSFATALALIAALLFVGGCDSASDRLPPVDASDGVLVTSDADLLAARDAWLAARPAAYRYAYMIACEECRPGDVVAVRDGRVTETRAYETDTAQTLDDLFETARGAFQPGYGGEIRLSQTTPRYPVLVRIGRTEPEPYPTSYSGLAITVTGFETLR